MFIQLIKQQLCHHLICECIKERIADTSKHLLKNRRIEIVLLYSKFSIVDSSSPTSSTKKSNSGYFIFSFLRFSTGKIRSIKLKCFCLSFQLHIIKLFSRHWRVYVHLCFIEPKTPKIWKMTTKLSIKKLELVVTKFFEADNISKFGALKSKKTKLF